MKSLRRHLTRTLLGLFGVLLGGGLLALYLFVREAVVRNFDTTLRAKALAIGTLTFQEGERVAVNFTDKFLRGFEDEEDARDFFELWHADGTVVARSESLRTADLPRHRDVDDKPHYWNFRLPNGHAGRAIAIAFKPRGDEPNTASVVSARVELVVASDREELVETLSQVGASVAVCGVLLLGATLWLVPRVLARGLRPLDRLGDQAARIDAESLGARFPSDAMPVELQAISGRLNDLLARLEASFERERRFSADLAHELRTPLAELRSLAECALKWPEARDPATDRDALAIARQMEAIVTRMLALARSERGQIALSCEPVALAPLVQEAWRVFAARAAAKNLRVTVTPPVATIETDPVLLRSILNNLFDNAVDYTPAGGEVRIAGEAAGAAVALRVTNTVAGLDADDVAKLFDRFWRKEAARSGGGEHVGLGLALARTFARAMNWQLSAELEGRGFLTFTLKNTGRAPQS
jgi:signal transduction histidine kinase